MKIIFIMCKIWHCWQSFANICNGYLSICRSYLPWRFTVNFHRGNSPQLFTTVIFFDYLPCKINVAICCEYLPWLFAMGFFVYVSKPFFCVTKSFFFVTKTFLNENKLFLNMSKTLLYLSLILGLSCVLVFSQLPPIVLDYRWSDNLPT